MASQLLWFNSRQFSGTRSALRWWRNAQQTETPARGFVWVLHGVGEHSGRYDELATFLTQFGFDVLCMDWPGHGMSALEGLQKKLVDFPEMLQELQDTFQAWNHDGPLAKRNVHLKPWYLMGHSMGALLALQWILKGKNPAAESGDFALRAFLSGPPLRLSMPVPEWKKSLAAKLAGLTPNLTIPNGIDADALSVDPVNVRAYKEDPLVHSDATPKWFNSMNAEAERVLGNPQDIEIPLCLAIGEHDPISDPKTNEEYFHSLRTHKKLIVCPGLKHEILNDNGRRSLYESVAAWFL